MLTRKARREILLIAMLALTIQLVYVVFYSANGYRQLQSRRGELNQLQIENQRLLHEQQLYLQKIEKLRSDPAEIERIARERYNFAKPGDVIVNIK